VGTGQGGSEAGGDLARDGRQLSLGTARSDAEVAARLWHSNVPQVSGDADPLMQLCAWQLRASSRRRSEDGWTDHSRTRTGELGDEGQRHEVVVAHRLP